MTRDYTVIVPAIDTTGPVNVAFDLARAAAERGYRVRVLYLSDGGSRSDGTFAHEIRRFRASDLLRLRGWVHTHCLRPDLLGALLSLNPRCRLVTTLHNFFLLDLGFVYSPTKVRLAWCLWRTALRRYDHVVCIAHAQRRYYRRKIPDVRFDLVHNTRRAADDATLPASIESWLGAQREASRLVLCFAGSLSRRKNVAALLDRLAALPDVALLLCGEGPERDALEQLARTRGMRARVHFAGHVSAPAAALARSDALVLPSLAEGFPLVVLEAASVGTPSLMSNIAVHRELAALGFGTTFDHRLFTDFEARLRALRQAMPVPHEALQRLWRTDFTPHAGFDRYAALLEHSA